MRFKALALGAVVSSGVCAPGGVLAQTMPAVEPKRDWTVGIRADAYYDSNIPRLNKAFPSTRGLEREDYVFTPAVTVALVQPFGRQAVFVNGDAGYTFYRRNSVLDRRRAKLTGGVATLLGRCRQVTFGVYDVGQSDLANLDVGTTKNLRETKSVAAGLQCALPAGPGASVVVQRADTKNSAATVKESDTTAETAAVSIFYGRPSLGTFNFAFNYVSAEFPNRIIPGRPVGDGFFSQSYMVGYQRDFGSRLKMTVTGGLSHTKREFAPPGIDQSFTTGAYSLDVIYGFGERIDFEARASRAIIPSQQVGKTFDKQTSAEGLVRYKAGRRLSLSTGLSTKETNSNVDTASSLLVVTDSRVDSVFGGVEFKPNDTLSLQVDLRYEEREANLPQFTYSATRVGLRALASF